MDAHAFGQHGKIYVRIADCGADMGVEHAAIAAIGHCLQIHQFLVPGPVVVHDIENRNLVMCRGPQCAGTEHQVAVPLDGDGQAAIFPVGQRRTQGRRSVVADA